MINPKKILIISDTAYKTIKLYIDQTIKLAKGFIRSGHDVRIFSYASAMSAASAFKSKTVSELFYKSKVDNTLADYAKNYQPDIVCVCFPRSLNAETIEVLRQAVPKAIFVGVDGDAWPKLQRNRIETAKKLDILIATNDGQFLQDYRDAGVPLSIFMPNMCDPDTDHRYQVGPEWHSDILWIGKAEHHADKSQTFRRELVERLAGMENCRLYGCCGMPQIGGIEYLYAISGAKIGVNINAVNNVRMYHSDRLTHYLACGVFVLAKRVPDSELLFKDGVHLKYFDTVDEFFDLTGWYLNREDERRKIADAGMEYTHREFNNVKMAGHLLELVEKGRYDAPWTR